MAKILHIMLTGPVTDGWSYQDNLLTKYHRRLGHEVTMITSQWVWGENGKLTKCEKTDYRNENDVKVIRLPIHGRDCWGRKLKTFDGLYEHMEAEVPDILFVHNVSFPDMDVVVRYIRKRFQQTSPSGEKELTVYVDNHADFSNSGRNWISRNLLHKILWRHKAKKIEPYVTRFYGVMPSRVDWLIHMYDLPKEKCELLVMGADDDGVARALESNARKRIRDAYGIAENDFLIMTGGKIDQAKKQTLLLMEAVRNLTKSVEPDREEEKALGRDAAENEDICRRKPSFIRLQNVKLLVFGSVAEELKEPLEHLTDGITVQYIGWIASELSYDYFSAADLVVFPGRHSVYWEQVVGMGIPMLCKYWEGSTHVDIGGNVKFLKEDSVSCLENTLLGLFKEDGKEYRKLKAAAESDRAKAFSYLQIAEKCIR